MIYEVVLFDSEVSLIRHSPDDIISILGTEYYRTPSKCEVEGTSHCDAFEKAIINDSLLIAMSVGCMQSVKLLGAVRELGTENFHVFSASPAVKLNIRCCIDKDGNSTPEREEVIKHAKEVTQKSSD